MATYDNVRSAVGKLSRTLTLYKENIEIVSENTLLLAGEAAARAMAEVILVETTDTGDARVAAGGLYAGRRTDTGAMYNSIYDDLFNENVGAAHVLTTRDGNVQLKVGFLNSPEYTKYQEEGTRTIKGMQAVQTGFLVARDVVFQDLIVAAREAGNDALADRLTKRGRKPV